MGRGREAWILGALVIVFIVATVYYGRQGFEEQRNDWPTTYGVGPKGLRAFYELLGRQATVARFERPLTRLPADAGVLVMAEPQKLKVGPEEQSALSDWIRKGGTLLLIVSGG